MIFIMLNSFMFALTISYKKYDFLAIFLFGVVGVVCRYFLSLLNLKNQSSKFPFGTFIINVTGSWCVGIFTVIQKKYDKS